MAEWRKIITRQNDPLRFTDNRSAIDPTLINTNISPYSSILIKENWKPAETADSVIAIYLSNDRKMLYVHCIQIKPDEMSGPSVQIFSDDIVIGNLNREGFYRSIIYLKDSDLDRRKIVEKLRELRRYQNGGVLRLIGIHSEM